MRGLPNDVFRLKEKQLLRGDTLEKVVPWAYEALPACGKLVGR
jgi:hypothetical protein